MGVKLNQMDLVRIFDQAMTGAKDVQFSRSESRNLGLSHINPQVAYDLLPADVKERVSLEDYRAICITNLAAWVFYMKNRDAREQEREIIFQIDSIASLR